MTKKQAETLLRWYSENSRHLPWREDPTPYHVWLSEIMLQQTRVEAVKPYYARFLSACPSIESLAKASEEECLKLWEGLGYYSRVRNLHKAAKIIVEEYQGKLPDDPILLSRLPGIGEYTMKAILSIAFQKPYISIDGNLLRVYARLNAKRFSSIDSAIKKEAEDYFSNAFPLNRPGDFNQALMDLGELVCLPNGAPLCQSCPLASFCKACKENNPSSYPGERSKKTKKSQDIDVFLLKKEGRYAIVKRPTRGLLAGLYELPNVLKRTSKNERFQWLKEHGLSSLREKGLGEYTHIFTHLHWNMKGYLIEVEGKTKDFLFLSKEEIESKYSIPSAFSCYLKKAGLKTHQTR